MDITLIWYLVPALVMFCCGVYGFLTRRNMIAMLISLELMLNAVDINFVVFNRYLFPGTNDGWMFTLFGIAIAAAETGSRHRHYHQPLQGEQKHRRGRRNPNETLIAIWILQFLYLY